MNVEVHSAFSNDPWVVGRLHVADDGTVVLEGADSDMEYFLRHFVTLDDQLNRYEIGDGEPWLRNLPRTLRGTYLWATEITSAN